MNTLVLIPLCFLAGLACKRIARFPKSSAQVLNAFVVQISLPALVLAKLTPFVQVLTLDRSLLVPISMAWLNFGLAWAFFQWLGKKYHWSPGTVGALVLTTGLGNTSFIGFPMIEAFMGPEALRIGILVDQPGSFLVLGTLGISAAAIYSGQRVMPRKLARRVLGFPPFQALCLAVLWAWLGTPGLHLALPILERLADTLVPLALFAVGFQLSFGQKILAQRSKPLAWAMLIKLLLAPAFFALLYFRIFHDTTFASRVTVLESAMAPMITSAVVAGEFGLDLELANLVVSLGILLSFATVPLWYWAIN